MACHLQIHADPVPDPFNYFDADPDLDVDPDPLHWLNVQNTITVTGTKIGSLICQDQLPAFLKTAERLKVKGLAEAPGLKNE